MASLQFFQAFTQDLVPFLLEVILESVEKGSLSPSLTQGLISLIPKPKKDSLLIDIWRPITLLNTDYNIFASIIAKRLNVLYPIIVEVQSRFMRKRHNSNNIRLVIDIIDYSFLCPDDSFFFLLDFYKAFDTVEHNFIFQTIEKFGFGKKKIWPALPLSTYSFFLHNFFPSANFYQNNIITFHKFWTLLVSEELRTFFP